MYYLSFLPCNHGYTSAPHYYVTLQCLPCYLSDVSSSSSSSSPPPPPPPPPPPQPQNIILHLVWDYSIWRVICTVVVLTCFVMCWWFVGVCFDTCVGVLVICVLVQGDPKKRELFKCVVAAMYSWQHCGIGTLSYRQSRHLVSMDQWNGQQRGVAIKMLYMFGFFKSSRFFGSPVFTVFLYCFVYVYLLYVLSVPV
jgi:hypothetical protein